MSPLPADLRESALRSSLSTMHDGHSFPSFSSPEFCPLPRVAARDGTAQLQMTRGTKDIQQGGCGRCACCIKLETLQSSVMASSRHSSALEDQLAGTRVQIIALQSDLEAMKREREKQSSGRQIQVSAVAELAECHRLIKDLRQELAECQERENARALWTITDRERQYHAQQIEQQELREMQQKLKDMQDKVALGQIQVEESQRRQEEAEDNVAKRRERLMRSIVARMVQTKMYAGFESWRQNAHDSMRRRRLGLRAVSRFRCRAAVLVFAFWADISQKCAAQREKMVRCVRRLMMRCAWTCFARWKEQAYQQGVAREGAKRAARRMLNQCLSAAWQRWLLRIDTGKSQRASATHVIKMLLNRSLSVAFQTWTHRVISLRRSRQIVTRCVNRFTQQSLVIAWEEWQEKVTQQKNARERQDLQQGMAVKLEHEQAEVQRLRENIVKLELELESIRRILEWRAGQEYKHLVDVSMENARKAKMAAQRPLTYSPSESFDELPMHFLVTHSSGKKKEAGLMTFGRYQHASNNSPHPTKRRATKLSAAEGARRSFQSPSVTDKASKKSTSQKPTAVRRSSPPRPLTSPEFDYVKDSTFLLSPDMPASFRHPDKMLNAPKNVL